MCALWVNYSKTTFHQFIVAYNNSYRPAKSHGISVSLQKSLLISRSHGNVTKCHGMWVILVIYYFSARNLYFWRISKNVCLYPRISLNGDHGKDSRNSTTSTWQLCSYRIVNRLPMRCSASGMFASDNVNSCTCVIQREAPWPSGRTLALDAARPRSIPVGGENY